MIPEDEVSKPKTAALHYSQLDIAMLTHISKSAPALLQKLQSGLCQLPFELIWSSHAQWPWLPGSSRSPVRISVLDSSFNPPTLAHLALANSKRPSYSHESRGTAYDAKILLLSVKNADKVMKPGDASYVQRLQMMGLLAQDISTHDTVGDGQPNIAIGIIDEPTFVGKSKVLKEYFALQRPSSSTQLSFIVGMDTLERLFSPKYYPSPPGQQDTPNEQVMVSVLSRMFSPAPGGDDSLVVCAKRSALPGDASQKAKGESGLDQTLARASEMGWLNLKKDEKGQGSFAEEGEAGKVTSVDKDERIRLIDIGDEESRFSSTAVRNSRNRTGVTGSEVSGGPWKSWVTKRVAAYIQNEKLYLP
ncbi:hypothetical protein BKA70DRAFT_1277801 [Coprinopsis sp. MPI-PUGE-AT-0042]|nr:hypothetical protein BKA70DRAFT_1277801 [Coprinopsis sp. MPI-PUGE-AT-0042]